MVICAVSGNLQSGEPAKAAHTYRKSPKKFLHLGENRVIGYQPQSRRILPNERENLSVIDDTLRIDRGVAAMRMTYNSELSSLRGAIGLR